MSATKTTNGTSQEAGSAPVTVRVGVSSCLMGQNVRVNGGHCRDRWLTGTLRFYIRFVPVCPEVEMGMPSPRPPMRLVTSEEGPRLVMSEGGEDRTDEMEDFTRARLEQLASDDLHGYILKKDSPTCGIFRVKLYGKGGVPSRDGTGVFARMLMERFPNLPVEEEGRLNDPILRENFILRAFTRARFRTFARTDGSPGGLVDFHARHKYLLMAHDQQTYRDMGRLVAKAGVDNPATVLAEYERLLMAALAKRASRGRHVNALMHLSGFVKKHIDADDKQELGRLIEEYRRGFVGLVVPLTLLRHLLRRHAPDSWATRQIYLEPYPGRLMLRNHTEG